MNPVRQLLWWLIAGSEGGFNRARIIAALRERPYNARQLARRLGLNYTTVRYHLEVLQKNGLITSTENRYGRMYFLSPVLLENYGEFEEIWAKVREDAREGEK
ncbi:MULTISPECIES: ArsR/SmtB family transcription factor [Thermococcus]|uniref:ArsR/SmtB family transcription factor n=1 Tax=Thermococcus TaxID=2263 RepID=UPI00073A74C4|nr:MULTISPECIES: winged helix-turn-helix domain-containing protein [Thermococcus]ALV63474.1 Transcriptional regulator, ArsR family [Thermococcus sp. 2319x1]MBP1912602.1 DNA-binding transcriptional ArsR family regulator [Thermococcus stetteri]